MNLKPKPSIKTLRPHQNECIESISINDRGVFILPTGTGKTLVQSRAIIDDINMRKGANLSPAVYIILSHRIVLANQLFDETRRDIDAHNIDVQYGILHSDSTSGVRDYIISTPYRELEIVNSIKSIQDLYNRSVREDVPLVISGLYDSSWKIRDAGIPIRYYLNDEAHVLVSDEFAGVVEYPSNKMFFFTATRRVSWENGLGMNNEIRFGATLIAKSWAEMVRAGEIVRARLHFATIVNDNGDDKVIKDIRAITESFDQHQSLLSDGIGAKMLITSRGSTNLDDIVSHPEMISYCNKNNIHIIDKSSVFGNRINGRQVSDDEFLDTLKAYGKIEGKRMIIIHIRTLTEGIDVPGITGIMPMNNMGVDVFQQTIGRAARLHIGEGNNYISSDRGRLYSGELSFDDTDSFIKPYAWVIVPSYGILGNEIRAMAHGILTDLRNGEILDREITVTTSRGVVDPDEIDPQNDPDSVGGQLINEWLEFKHEIENEKEARRLAERIGEISGKTLEKKFSMF